jgi:hypothetical protein
MKTTSFLVSMSLIAISILVISNIESIQACTTYENCIRTIPYSAIQIAPFNGNHGTYGIPYSMSNGTLMTSLLDLPAKELLFTFNATGDGKLTVELPRQVIDSTRDGKDKPYLVFVGTWERGTHRIRATEIQNDNGTRTLEIGFTKGDNHIGIVGTYFIENNSTSTISNRFGAWSPLQQYEKGFDAQDVVCKSGLQLLIKAEDDTPACVKLQTAQKLVERGWIKETIQATNVHTSPKYNASPMTSQATKIIPPCVSQIPHQYAIAGPPGFPLCPIVNFEASGKILNATGFYGIYNYTAYPSTQNFVLEPGHNGTITYLISINAIHNFGNVLEYSNEINVTNDVAFMHDAGMNNHPGVDVLAEPKSEMIGNNESTSVSITFSVSKSALPGNYWVTLPPGVCTGGQMIVLTITDCEK